MTTLSCRDLLLSRTFVVAGFATIRAVLQACNGFPARVTSRVTSEGARRRADRLGDDVPVTAPAFQPAWARLVTAWLAAGESGDRCGRGAAAAGARPRACTRWTCPRQRPGHRRPGPALRGRRRPAGRGGRRGRLRGPQPGPGRTRGGACRALLPARLAGAAQPEPRLRRVVVLGGVPRPHRRVRDRDQPAGALPARRPAPRAAPAARARSAARVQGLGATTGLPVRDVRPGRAGRRLRRGVRRRAGPACRRVRARRRFAGAGPARAAVGGDRGVGARARRPRLRLVEPPGRGPGRLGRARGVRRGAARERLVLAAPAARRGVRGDGRQGGRLLGPPADRPALRAGAWPTPVGAARRR